MSEGPSLPAARTRWTRLPLLCAPLAVEGELRTEELLGDTGVPRSNSRSTDTGLKLQGGIR